jgi:methylenetetrahydrofolate dehydrogenase (NADP+)/methenyltetrahydrofolate cyclohydrolase
MKGRTNMNNKVLDGKALAQKVKSQLKAEVEQLKAKGINPGLAVILVGENPASQIYVRLKCQDCDQLGIHSEQYTLPEETTEEELLALIDKLNHDDNIHGILVQLPVPKHINETNVINAISPSKDVDAFHPENVGKIMTGDYQFLPCTPAGVMDLIDETGIDLTGKNCVVVGRSNIVGKPQAMLLLHRNATVTICHSKTVNLNEICAQADVLVVAVGRANLIGKDAIKEGAVVIDVGMNKLPDGKLCGDVNYEEAEPKASYITPVPGGVGPMTRATLMRNTVNAAKFSSK